MEKNKITNCKSGLSGTMRATLIVAVVLLVGVFMAVSFFGETEAVAYTQIEDDAAITSDITSYMDGNNLVIEYETDEDKIWVEGLEHNKYSIEHDKVIIYNYQKYDKFNLHIGAESDIYVFGEELIYNPLYNIGDVCHSYYNEVDKIMTDTSCLEYKTESNGVISINNERFLAFALKGVINGNEITKTSMDFGWTWEVNESDGDYIFTATNDNPNFIWEQRYYFYKDYNKPMKIEHYLENNLNDITDMQMYYLTNVLPDDKIKYNETEYLVSEYMGTYKQGNLNDIISSINFNSEYDFNFKDLITNGFDINEFYIGSGLVIGVPSVNITAIGFTKNNGNFLKGTSVLIDPTFSTNDVEAIKMAPIDGDSFILGWCDEVDDKIKFSIYNTNGTIEVSTVTVTGDIGTCQWRDQLDISSFNGTDFVVGWSDSVTTDIFFEVFNVNGSSVTGPISVENFPGSGINVVGVSAFNSSTFVIGYGGNGQSGSYKNAFEIFLSNGTNMVAETDIADASSTTDTLSVSAFNDTSFLFAWFDDGEDKISSVVYDSEGNLTTARINITDTAGSVDATTINSTAYMVNLLNSTTASYRVFNINGTEIVSNTVYQSQSTSFPDGNSIPITNINNTAVALGVYEDDLEDMNFLTVDSFGNSISSLTTVDNTASEPYLDVASKETATGIELDDDLFIFAYSKSPTEAIWSKYFVNGTADGFPLGITITNPLALNYTISPSVLNWTTFGDTESCWYSNNNGGSNTTVTCTDLNTSISPSQGDNTYYMFVNDSAGIITSDVVAFTLDSTNPGIEIVNPLNATYYLNRSTLNYTYTDANNGSCWMSNNSGAANLTAVAAMTNFSYLNTTEGSNTWTLYCNDSYGNLNETFSTFFIDTGTPNLTITFPTNVSNHTSVITELNYSANDPNLDVCWYSLNGGAANTTVTCGNNVTGLNSGQGGSTWQVWANDSAGNLNTTITTFFVDSVKPAINVTYPFGTITNNTVGDTLYFNWTATDATSNLSSCWFNYNNTNTTVTCGDQNTTFVTTITGQKNLTFYSNDTLNNVANWTKNWNWKMLERNRTFNATSYETTTEYFVLNMSSDGTQTVTAEFWYNNSNYTATKIGNNEEMIFTSSISHPWEASGNRSFYWTVSHGGTLINTSSSGQDIQPIAFGQCNATLVSPFLNFTFKDENTDAFINSTFAVTDWIYFTGDGSQNKSFSYTNTTEQESYSFCASPNFTFHNNATIKYEGTGYPQRIYAQSTDLTNTTLFTTLYLLATADGQSVSFQTQDQFAQTITGATIKVEKQISDAWTLIGEDLTDAAGVATFFLNPDDNHRITTSKESYTTASQVIRPTQTSYTIVMSSSQGTSTDYMWEGISYNTYPNTGTFLAPNTSYDFGFNVSSIIGNITTCKLEITNSSFDIIGSAVGCGAYGGNITLNLGTDSYNKFYGNYYVNLGAGYQLLKSNDVWMIESVNFTGTGPALFSYMNNFKNWTGFSDDVSHNAAEFNRITFFFILLVIALGLFTKATGMESLIGLTMGYTLLILWPIIILFSIVGMFEITGIIRNAWLSKYYVLLVTTFITWGFLINHWRTRYT